MTKYDLHNYKLKFNITHIHNFKKGKQVKMNNWTAYYSDYKGHKIQVNPSSVLIWTKKRHQTENVKKTSDEIILNLTKTAIEFCNQNNIKINQIPIPIGKEIKVLDYKVNGNFITPKMKAVYPKPSHVEYTDPRTAEKDALKFVANMEDWIKMQQEQIMINQQFSKNIEKHLQVMDNINRSLESIKNIAVSNISKKPSLIQRILTKLTGKVE